MSVKYVTVTYGVSVESTRQEAENRRLMMVVYMMGESNLIRHPGSASKRAIRDKHAILMACCE